MGPGKGFKYRFCLQKAYFETGLGLTNYVKYLIAFFGLASADVKTTLIIGVIYAVLCYIIGRYWIIHGWAEQNQEVINNYNLFVRKMLRRKV